MLTGDGRLLAPVPENVAPVSLITTAITITIFVYATPDDNEETAFSFMVHFPNKRDQRKTLKSASLDAHSGVVVPEEVGKL